jgi:hypothetical protein
VSLIEGSYFAQVELPVRPTQIVGAGATARKALEDCLTQARRAHHALSVVLGLAEARTVQVILPERRFAGEFGEA